jgi:hypothetical protein
MHVMHLWGELLVLLARAARLILLPVVRALIALFHAILLLVHHLLFIHFLALVGASL